MYTQQFHSPLIPNLIDLYCDHNAFAHRVFPRIVQHNGLQVFEELEASPQSAADFLTWSFEITNGSFAQAPNRSLLALRDIAITANEIAGHPFLILSLTKPQYEIESYCIGLLHSLHTAKDAAGHIRYFTLEHDHNGGNLLCEWSLSGDHGAGMRHLNHGAGSKPTPAAFQTRVHQFLTFEADSSDSLPQK
jgi:hypothetical protein